MKTKGSQARAKNNAARTAAGGPLAAGEAAAVPDATGLQSELAALQHQMAEQSATAAAQAQTARAKLNDLRATLADSVKESEAKAAEHALALQTMRTAARTMKAELEQLKEASAARAASHAAALKEHRSNRSAKVATTVVKQMALRCRMKALCAATRSRMKRGVKGIKKRALTQGHKSSKDVAVHKRTKAEVREKHQAPAVEGV
jgi:hypothetical protein